ncbi:MAG: hypothetical protein QGI24_05610 [Kiritimatiellia bacterium]|jgi:hypothetical protein|nr:hypothetical protein [Kiritimatiellia bacterium]MDP6848245.1 hypothetical protein [Kiritimatiellia bacterium]
METEPCVLLERLDSPELAVPGTATRQQTVVTITGVNIDNLVLMANLLICGVIPPSIG